SVNECVCHGIPDSRPLEEGDIVNLDISLYHDGFHSDLNETVFVGRPDPESIKLVIAAYECLWASVEDVRPGMFYRNIAKSIEARAAEDGFSVVKTYCGHGVHKQFHTLPTVPHYAGNRAAGVMQSGHCFTIEPMINQGERGDVLWPDNWTSTTPDGRRSAQFEETMLVTDDGVDILTMRPNPKPHFARQLDDLGIAYELKVGPGSASPRWADRSAPASA
ncbi:Methionine aminopeptidase 1, partial [Diplonema papillatum]